LPLVSPPDTDHAPARFLIAAGVGSYPALGKDQQLPSVPEDIRLIVDLFTRRLGYRRVLAGVGADPTAESLRRALDGWFHADVRTTAKALGLTIPPSLLLRADQSPAFRWNRSSARKTTTSSGASSQALESAAGSLKVEVQRFETREPREFEGAFARMATSRVDALVVTTDYLFNDNIRVIADLAAKKRLPAAGAKELAEAGGLIGYGLNFPEMYRRVAYFVDKILKGAKPEDLPVHQPTKFDLVVNLKTAKALGLTIPQSILARADEIIQ
jgi:ABC transporter substrate binding protein